MFDWKWFTFSEMAEATDLCAGFGKVNCPAKEKRRRKSALLPRKEKKKNKFRVNSVGVTSVLVIQETIGVVGT